MFVFKLLEFFKVSEDEDVGVLGFFWNLVVFDLGVLKNKDLVIVWNEVEILYVIYWVL